MTQQISGLSADEADARSLRLTEIFFSLQGETSYSGLPTVFVRLTGCPLRCVWCDTAYAFQGGTRMTIAEILEAVAKHPTRYVTVTGGEPLAQNDVHSLMRALCDAGYTVSLETSGALDIGEVDPRVARIVDIKAPASGEAERNRLTNLVHLTDRDELKFVLADRADFEWARAFLAEHGPLPVREVLFSPVADILPPSDLAAWILAAGLPVRMQLQLHKQIWGNAQGV